MNRRRPPVRRGDLPSAVLLLTVLLALLLAAATAGAAPDRRRIASLKTSLTEALRGGDDARAMALITELRHLVPDDPLLLYNLACVSARLGQTGRAVAALGEAFRRGFDDVRRAAADPDLATLRDDPDFTALLEEWHRRLAERAGAAALRLRDGEPSPPLHLRWERGGGESPVTVTVRFDDAGFHLDLAMPAGAWQDRPEAWRRGGGVVVTLAVPDSADTFDTRRAWRFGFGQRDGEPVGLLLQQPDRWVGQRVLELAPTIDWDPAGAQRRIGITIPWSYLAPYAPPVDTLWGLNVRHCGRDDAGGLRVDSLVPDPAAVVPAVVPGRFAPVTLAPSGAAPRFHGRVAATVVGDRPLRIDLAAWSDRAGTARLETSITDNTDRSVVTSGTTTAVETLRVGLNHWTRWADLSALPDGPYRLRARLVLDDSTALAWRTGLFRFRPAWLDGAREKTAALPGWARPTLEHRLSLIESVLSGRDPRAGTAPLLTTVAEVDDLLERFARTGTILAPGTTLIAAYTAGDGTLSTCPLELPDGWSPAGRSPVLVLVGDDRLVTALHDALTTGRPTGDGKTPRLPVLASPALRERRDDPGAAGQDLIEALGWLREAVGGPLWLAPLGGEGAALLAAVRDLSGLVDDTWIPEGSDLAALAADLRRWLAARTPTDR